METEINKELLAANQITINKKVSALSFVIFVAAVLVLAMSFCINSESSLKMPLIFLAILLFAYGGGKFLSARKTYVHLLSDEELKKQVLYFDSKEKNNVMEMLRNGEIEKIINKGSANCDLPIMVELYATDSRNIAIYRVFAYIPYTFEPLTEYEIFKR